MTTPYINIWIAVIDEICSKIESDCKDKVEHFRKTRIKEESEFDTYQEYLSNLKVELCNRKGDDREYLINDFINILNFIPRTKRNKIAKEKYVNAIKYSVSYLHKALQKMEFESSEYTGISNSNNMETTIWIEVNNLLCKSSELQEYHYNLEKTLIDFLSKYVDINGTESDNDLYSLVQLALYFNCLENECVLNSNIPNEMSYTFKIL